MSLLPTVVLLVLATCLHTSSSLPSPPWGKDIKLIHQVEKLIFLFCFTPEVYMSVQKPYPPSPSHNIPKFTLHASLLAFLPLLHLCYLFNFEFPFSSVFSPLSFTFSTFTSFFSSTFLNTSTKVVCIFQYIHPCFILRRDVNKKNSL